MNLLPLAPPPKRGKLRAMPVPPNGGSALMALKRHKGHQELFVVLVLFVLFVVNLMFSYTVEQWFSIFVFTVFSDNL